MMDVKNHRLEGPNVDHKPLVKGGVIEPKYIIIHYTAGGKMAGSWNALNNRGLSAHLLVERDGGTLHCVDFNRKAFHAGKSAWKGLKFLNGHSIGIELCNYGWMFKRGDGTYQRPATFGATPVFQPDEVVVSSHKNGWPNNAGWELYPDAQLQATMEICKALLKAYPSIRDILGHDDISPDRKQDPGPAFPMSDFRGLMDGQDDIDDDDGVVGGPGVAPPPPPGQPTPSPTAPAAPGFASHVVTAKSGLNVRSGPGTGNAVVHVLRNGQRVGCVDDGGPWMAVDHDNDGLPDGFVHRAFVRAA